MARKFAIGDFVMVDPVRHPDRLSPLTRYLGEIVDYATHPMASYRNWSTRDPATGWWRPSIPQTQTRKYWVRWVPPLTDTDQIEFLANARAFHNFRAPELSFESPQFLIRAPEEAPNGPSYGYRIYLDSIAPGVSPNATRWRRPGDPQRPTLQMRIISGTSPR